MPLNHETLIELIEKLDYPVNKGGMCYGYAVMGMQAVIAKDFSTFTDRLQKIERAIESSSVDDLAKRIKNLEKMRVDTIANCRKKLLNGWHEDETMSDADFYKLLKGDKAKNSEYRKAIDANLSTLDTDLSDIRAFVELLTLYFSPRLFPFLFHENSRPTNQNAALTFTRGLPPKLVDLKTEFKEQKEEKEHKKQNVFETKEEALVKKANTFVGKYNFYQLVQYFTEINPGSLRLDPPIAFLLSTADHSFSITYDNNTQSWILIDAAKMPIVSCGTETELVSAILSKMNSFAFDVSQINRVDNTEIPRANPVLSKNSSIEFLGDTETPRDNPILSTDRSVEDDFSQREFGFPIEIFSTEQIALSEENIIFSMEVYCHKDQLDTVNSWLSKVTTSNTWNELHEINETGSFADSKELSRLFFSAVSAGDLELVKKLLQCKNPEVDINEPLLEHPLKLPALFLAARCGHTEIVKELLENKRQKANINQTIEIDGLTPFHSAAYNGHLNVVKELLKYSDLDINKEDSGGMTAFGRAAGMTAFGRAAENGMLEVVRFLLEHTTNLDKNLGGPLVAAAQNGYVDVVKTLLDHQIDPNTTRTGLTALYVAAGNGHVEVVKTLLDHQIDPNTTNNGLTALYIAAENGHVEVVKTLLNYQIDPNVTMLRGVTALYIAAQNGHAGVVTLLLANQTTKTLYLPIQADVAVLLKEASKIGCEQQLKNLFLEKGLDSPNLLENFTPLHAAIFFGHTEAVKIFVAAKFDVGEKTKENISGLEFAKAMNRLDIIKILQEATPQSANLPKSRLVQQSIFSKSTARIEDKEAPTASSSVNTKGSTL